MDDKEKEEEKKHDGTDGEEEEDDDEEGNKRHVVLGPQVPLKEQLELDKVRRPCIYLIRFDSIRMMRVRARQGMARIASRSRYTLGQHHSGISY
jgi:hypothetical protein